MFCGSAVSPAVTERWMFLGKPNYFLFTPKVQRNHPAWGKHWLLFPSSRQPRGNSTAQGSALGTRTPKQNKLSAP